MPTRRDKAIEQLARSIGYDFADRALLDLALTHASARLASNRNEDNERLEFLGDRVLGLAIAELLITTFPKASEGELARRYNSLVRWETCAGVATSWQLLRFVRFGGGKVGAGATRVLGDACEAVLGAVFLDGGYEAARRVVHEFWRSYLHDGALDAASAKSSLQEWAQGRGLALPRYSEVSREGPDHAPRFTAEVAIDGMAPERGQGMSKQAAEQAAALAMLRREGVVQAGDNG